MFQDVASLAHSAVAILALALFGLSALFVARNRRARRALRVSEERLRLALEATSEIVWDWDLPADRIYHPRWAATYGYPPEKTPRNAEELGRFIHPDDLPAFGALMQEVAQGGREAIELEHRALAASGEWRWMVARARVVARDGRGRALRMVGTCTDVTERKKLGARLQIADRLAAVGTLAAGVAHEINNPLAYAMSNVHFALSALGRAEAGLAGPAAEPVRRTVAECGDALREAQDGMQRVRDIVRDLKVLSRADEEGRAPVQVGKVLRAALNLAGGEIRSRARLETSLEPVPAVLASESRLSQVFLNLLVNAAQAIPEGRAGENRIRATVRPGAAGRVVVEVRDTGCGIAPEHRQRIFDPFFTTKPPGVGTGLGLAICHGIVTSLGGGIEVESEVGRGSTFRVTLPGTSLQVPVDQDTPVAGPPPPRRARVMVVDDEPLFCRAMERMLAAEHDVVSIGDPREALRRVQEGEHFDVVLSDLVMPRMSGMELHAEVARISPALGERMLFVTGGAFTPAAAEFVVRWPDRVLDKPVSPERVRAALKAMVERASGGSPVPVT